MTHALNLTLPLKQDPESQAKLEELAEAFETLIQPKIDKALDDSGFVHFARVLVIDNKYIQIITHPEYTKFFRERLTKIFEKIFALAEGAPDVNDPDEFFKYAKKHNIRSLGMSTSGSTTFDDPPNPPKPAGYLFSAYHGKSVQEIRNKLAS
jgi:hypothetical protein